MKVFNYSELHFAEVTFYKIHTLGSNAIKEQEAWEVQEVLKVQ